MELYTVFSRASIRSCEREHKTECTGNRGPETGSVATPDQTHYRVAGQYQLREQDVTESKHQILDF